MKKFDVEISETLQRKVSVEAASQEDAERMVTQAWNNQDYVLDSGDALTSAFEEFTNRKLKAKEKPSVLEQLNKLKELVAAILPDKVRHKSQERDL